MHFYLKFTHDIFFLCFFYLIFFFFKIFLRFYLKFIAIYFFVFFLFDLFFFKIKLTCCRDADGVHDYIGKVTTTFREFTFGPFDFGLNNKNKEGRQALSLSLLSLSLPSLLNNDFPGLDTLHLGLYMLRLFRFPNYLLNGLP